MNIDDGDIYMGEFANGALCSIQTSFVTVGNYPGIEARIYGSEGRHHLPAGRGGRHLRAAVAGDARTRSSSASSRCPSGSIRPAGTPRESWRSLFYANLVSSFITEILADDDAQRGQLRRRRLGAGDDQRRGAVVPGAPMGDAAARVAGAGAAPAVLDRFFAHVLPAPAGARPPSPASTSTTTRCPTGRRPAWLPPPTRCGRCAASSMPPAGCPTTACARFPGRRRPGARRRAPRDCRSPSTRAGTSSTATRRCGPARRSSACSAW